MNQSYFGVMLDCSRNGVIKVSKVKQFIDIISAFGYNCLQLYTEDTFEVDNEPYFNYMRGGYTKEELKEIDVYAKSKGVELIPCIQTLAHLNAIFNWNEYKKINDTKDILLIDEDRTYQLLDNIFSTLRSCCSSKLINIGMDEAEMVGLGKYLNLHGYVDRFTLLKKHLDKVVKIAKKYDFTPIMWSDMFFKMATEGIYELHDYNNIPKIIYDNLPSDVHITYWNYYHEKDYCYTNMLKTHKKLDSGCWFAGGAWTWTGFAPHNKWSIATMKSAMKCCRKTGVNNILITVWGDDGQECSHFAVLPSLFYAIKTYNGETKMSVIKKEFKEITGEDFDAFMALDLPNDLTDHKSVFSPCKYGFYNDVLNGLCDLYIPKNSTNLYKKYYKRLSRLAKNSPNFSYLFNSMAKLCDFLSVKFDLGVRLRSAYKENNKEQLKAIVKDIRVAQKKLSAFYDAHQKRWYTDFNPQGFDVQDIRIGGLMQRLKTAERTISDYLDGKIDKISELEIEILPLNQYKDPLLGGYHLWRRAVSPSVIHH